MTMTCQVCNHPKRLEIDRMIVEGKSQVSIARQFGVSSDSLRGHSQNHLSRQLVQAYEKKRLAEDFDLLSRIENILSKAEKIFQRNYAKKRDALALKALSEQRSTIELLAKIAAYLHESRAMELQSSQQDYETRRDEEDREYAVLVCDRLNDAESDLYIKLVEKIQGLRDDDIVPYQKTNWLEYEPEKDPSESIENPTPYKDIPSGEIADSQPEIPYSAHENQDNPSMKRTRHPSKPKNATNPIPSIKIPGGKSRGSRRRLFQKAGRREYAKVPEPPRVRIPADN